MRDRVLPALLLALSGAVQADPMRPLVVPGAASAASSTAMATATVPRPQAAAPRLPPLVAIREDSGGRRLALFGERWLLPGDMLDGHVVDTIGAHQVELTRGSAHLTLHLLAPLQATPAAGPAAEAAAGPAPHSAPHVATPLRRPRSTALVQAARGTRSSTR